VPEGRLDGAEIARRVTMHEGQVPLHTLRADIDYGFVEAKTAMGRIGIKVWLYKGDILPEVKEVAAEEPAGEIIEETIAQPPVVAEPAMKQTVTEVDSKTEEKAEVTPVKGKVKETEAITEKVAEPEAVVEVTSEETVKVTDKAETEKVVEVKPKKASVSRVAKAKTTKGEAKEKVEAAGVEQETAKVETKKGKKKEAKPVEEETVEIAEVKEAEAAETTELAVEEKGTVAEASVEPVVAENDEAGSVEDQGEDNVTT